MLARRRQTFAEFAFMREARKPLSGPNRQTRTRCVRSIMSHALRIESRYFVSPSTSYARAAELRER